LIKQLVVIESGAVGSLKKYFCKGAIEKKDESVNQPQSDEKYM